MTDNDQATRYTSEDLTVTPPPSTVVLSEVRGYTVKGRQRADLIWSGARTAKVDIYRNSARIVTTINDGFHTDNINRTGSGSYEYQICEARSSVCSNKVTVSFK